jgi:hypothetical protein
VAVICVGCGSSGATHTTNGTTNSGGQSPGNAGGSSAGGTSSAGMGNGEAGLGSLIPGLGGANANDPTQPQGGSSDPGAAGTDPGNGTVTPRFAQYIQGTQFSKLVFEVDSVEGQEPRTAITTRLPERFAPLLDKPGGIEVVLDDTLPPHGNDFVWSNEDLDQITRDSFDGDPDSDTLAIHITYVDGHSAGDGDNGVILGVAWGWLQVVMYKETIESSCGGLGLIGTLREQACEEAEVGILTHEIGHVLGLVDNGLTMVDDHRDPDTEHGAHDVDQDCIMYWAYEGQGLTELIGSRLLSNNDDSLTFCQHCLDDLNAVK